MAKPAIRTGELPEARQRLSAVAGVVGDGDGDDAARLLYDRIRLGLMSALSVHPALSFAELKDLLGTTDGNLSVHARRLEEAGYVVCKKSFDGRLPRTEYRLAERGRQALKRYLDHMEALIHAVRS